MLSLTAIHTINNKYTNNKLLLLISYAIQLSRGYANQKCGIICVNSGCFIRKPVFEKVVYVQIACKVLSISGTHGEFLPATKTLGSHLWPH